MRAGDYETIYVNMPPFGLGRVTRLVPVSRRGETAGVRIGSDVGREPAVEGY